MKIGIVGLPNVGKSTLFKALTKKQVEASNYPFCTIEPNIGVVEVPDERLNKLAELYNSAKVVPAVVEFVDIAGLVKNAHQGEGLGNQFLSHIREVDAVAHVIRNFHYENIVHVEGEVNPRNDLATIVTELAMADMTTVEKALQKVKLKIKANDKEAGRQQEILEKMMSDLDQGRKPETDVFKDEDKKFVKSLNLLSLKPELYIENIDEAKLKDFTPTISGAIPVCAKLEAELAELAVDEAQEYLKELGIRQTGLDQIILASYRLLDLITFFTAGPKEVHAWTIQRGTKAPQAAGKIHTDFEKGFIRAEVINWQDLLEAGGEVVAKEKGLVRLEGKDYVFQDGDVAVFRFSK